MAKPQVVSDQNFEAEVIKSDTPVLVDFWAVWCGPCRMVAPVLEEIATEQGDKVKIAKLDVDANPITARRFGVRAIPTMILFKNGREAQRVVGYVPKDKLLQQMHPHRDIEGITYVAEGTFEHADSRGNGGVLPPGSVQRATLGSGMQHSERNGSKTESMRFIQMWIMPSRRGLEPSIEQREFSAESRRNTLKPVLVPAPGYRKDGAPRAGDTVTVHQDAAVYAALLDPRTTGRPEFRRGPGGYLFMLHGPPANARAATAGAPRVC